MEFTYHLPMKEEQATNSGLTVRELKLACPRLMQFTHNTRHGQNLTVGPVS
jgi:hypothetical protein